jgi:hypothetical protein
MMIREYEYCLDTCSLYVSVDTYKRRKKKFGWVEMGIVVKIHVPIHVLAVTGRHAVAVGWPPLNHHSKHCMGKNKMKNFKGLSNGKNMVFYVKKL